MSDKPVGYRNPPVASRFPKGQSGNPGGRKKDSRNFKTVLDEVMAREVEQPGHGKKRRCRSSRRFSSNWRTAG